MDLSLILDTFSNNDKIAVAFSGGTDSCCLAYILKKK